MNQDTGVLDILRQFTPFWISLEKDEVDPLAAVKLLGIGLKFPCNLGKPFEDCIAKRDLWGLRDVGAIRAALISFFLVSNFGKDESASLLADLLSAMNPALADPCDKVKIGHAVATMSGKLEDDEFRSIWQSHEDNIKNTLGRFACNYPSLFNIVALETMLQFLVELSKAFDGGLQLRIEGYEGVGRVVTLAMALCPDDVWISVGEEIVLKGKRDLVNISVTHKGGMKSISA